MLHKTVSYNEQFSYIIFLGAGEEAGRTA